MAYEARTRDGARAERGTISAGLNARSAAARQVLDHVGVLARPDHPELAGLALERRGAGDFAQLLLELGLLLLELGELMLRGLRPLPRLHQVHQRVEVGDHHPEQDQDERHATDAVPADPAWPNAPPNP